MISGQMRLTLSVEKSDNLKLQSGLSDIGCCIEHVKWRVISMEMNGIEHGVFDFYIRFEASMFTAVFELLKEYHTESEVVRSNRVRNVMAKNIQHGMRVEFPNGQVGEVNAWNELGSVTTIAAPGGLSWQGRRDTKLRVHP